MHKHLLPLLLLFCCCDVDWSTEPNPAHCANEHPRCPDGQTCNVATGHCETSCPTDITSPWAVKWAVQINHQMSVDGDMRDVAVTPDGDLVVVGYFSQSADLGCPTKDAKGTSDMFVARLSPQGTCRWLNTYGAAGSIAAARNVAVTKTGDIVVSGNFAPSLVFNNTTLTAVSAQPDLVVFRLTSSGESKESFVLSGSSTKFIAKMAVNDQGELALAGSYYGTISIGPNSYTSNSSNNEDIFVAKYKPFGNLLFSGSYGGPGADIVDGMVMDAAGDLRVAGWFSDMANFGNGAVHVDGLVDMYLAKYSGQTGALLATHTFGGPGDDLGLGVAIDPSERTLLVGWTDNVLDLGGGPLPHMGDWDAVIASYNADGSHRFSKSFGSSGQDTAAIPVRARFGQWAVAGKYNSTIDLGGGPLPALPPSADGIYVAQFDTYGNHLASKGVSADMQMDPRTMVITSDCQAVVASQFQGVGTLDSIKTYSATKTGLVFLVGP